MDDFIIPFLGGFLGFLLGVTFSIPTLKRIVEIHRSSSNTADSSSDGKAVEIFGKILADSRTLYSPVTHIACVLWHVEVLEDKSSSEDSDWETVFDETSAHSFEMKDDTGIVRVYPQSAELVLHDDFYKESSLLASNFEPTLRAALEKLLPLADDGVEYTRPLRIHEQVLKAGETVSILGRIADNNGVRVISVPSDGSPFLISDRSHTTLIGTLLWRMISRTALLTVLGVYIAHFFQT